MRLSSIILCVAICTSQIAAQVSDTCQFTLSGRVIDDHDGQPLEFATILLLETGKGEVSDSAGYFVISGLCAGVFTLRVSHIGCETLERTVSVSGNTTANLLLEHHSEVLDAIELTAHRVRTAGSVASETLSEQTLAVTRGEPIGQVLKNLPGVNAIQTGPAIFKPVIHGFHSNRVLIVNDGIRQESQQWGLDHAPEVDPFLATKLTVVKGAAAVQYGSDAVAGVVLIEQDTLPIREHLTGKVALYGMTNGWQGGASGLVQSGVGNNFGIRGHITAKRGGDYRAPSYQLTNTGLRELNTSVTAGYRRGLTKAEVQYSLFTTEIGILRSAHIGNLADLEAALERGEPFIIDPFSYNINNPRQRVQHHLLKFQGQKFIEGLGMLSGHYAFQFNKRREYDVRRGGRDDIPALSLELATQTAEARLAHESVFNLRGNIGLHWQYQKNSNVPGTGVRPLVPNYNTYSPGISIVEKWIGDNIEVEAGARYEYRWLKVQKFDSDNVLRTIYRHFNNFSTSAGIRWDVSDKFAFTANIGSTTRAPSVNEMFSEGLHHGAAAIEEGDTNLVSEKAMKIISGVEYRSGRVRGQASAYYQNINDFIYLRPDGEPRLTIRGAFPVFSYVQTDARIWGVDGAIQIDITRQIQLESKYSMVRARDVREDAPLIYMPSDRMSHALKWHNPTDKFHAGMSFNYVWEQTRVPGIDYAPPPDAFSLFGLFAGVSVLRGEHTLDIYIAVDNLFNTKYREYLNRLRYFADDTGRNFTLRIQYSF